MSFKLENFGADSSNAKSTLGGVRYYRYFNEENNTLTTAGYFPANLGLEVGDRIRVIPAVKTNADELYVVTSTANRTVTVTQIDTDGAVDSVNGKTGHVVLDASDVGALPASTVIPEATQVSALPTASADEEGKIYQFVGTTDASYTNGYFYKCVSDGQNPATYSWSQVDVQPAADPLPSQTGQSGKFLTTDGSTASWSDKPIINNSTAFGGIAIGDGSTAVSGRAVAIGYTTSVGSFGVAIGDLARAGNKAIQISCGSGSQTNNTANTFKVGNDNGNFEIMSADGTIPADRLASTSGLTDGNYRLRLTMASGVPTLTWVAE